jgi:hypothetical protein
MPAKVGVSEAISANAAAGVEQPRSVPSSAPRSRMISKSGRAAPGGSSAGRTRWTRRSKFVNVPSFSRKAAAGRTTSASEAVAERKISCETTSSQASIAALT